MRYFPSYEPRRPGRRFRACVLVRHDGGMWLIDGAESFPMSSWGELRELVIRDDLMLFTGPLTDQRYFPFLSDAEQDRRAVLHWGIEGVKISVRGPDRFLRWIVPSVLWGTAIPDQTFQWTMRQTFDLLGASRPTPGSLGRALMVEGWAEHNRRYRAWVSGEDQPEEYHELKRWHALPCKAARLDIKANLIGGRVQYLDGRYLPDQEAVGTSGHVERLSDVLPGHWKVDQNDALVSHYQSHPSGTVVRVLADGTAPELRTWFCHCRVTIREPLILGIFPVRVPTLHWPTIPGTYDTWLWREQWEDCIARGLAVEVGDGWGWRRWTEDNRAWAQAMIRLRAEAPTPEVRALVKRVTAAGISCQGIGDASYSLVPASERAPEDIPLFDGRGRLRYSLRLSMSGRYPTPVHWFAYTWMQVSRTLYREALPHAQANRLAAVLTDCLYLTEKPAIIPQGYKLEEILR